MITITSCRSCGNAKLTRVLDLGTLPLANALLDHPADSESRYPLTLAFCSACSLTQIEQTLEPSLLFSHYPYFSSFSDTMLAHARAQAQTLVAQRQLGPQSYVVEVGSNDGYLLKNFVELGVPVLGIDPAANVVPAAAAKGVPTLCAFFGSEVAENLVADGRKANVLIGNNVLAHVADIHGFLDGVSHLLDAAGCAVFEVPYVRDMLDRTEFDTIYHEHLCYFSVHSLRELLHHHGLTITHVYRFPIHGGSIRVVAEPKAVALPSSSLEEFLSEESSCGLTELDYYRSFTARVELLCEELLSELSQRKARGQRLAAYGASAKGSTLMNHAGIDHRFLDFIVDASTEKQGRFAPGNHLPILKPEELMTQRPTATLLLTWNFAEEIIRQQRKYIEAGGEFILPLPHVKTISASNMVTD